MAIIVNNMLHGTALSGSTSSGERLSPHGAHGGAGAALPVKAILLTSVPAVTGSLAAILCAWHSDARKERHLHIAVPWLMAGVLLAVFGPANAVSFAVGFAALVVAKTLASASSGVFSSLLVGASRCCCGLVRGRGRRRGFCAWQGRSQLRARRRAGSLIVFSRPAEALLPGASQHQQPRHIETTPTGILDTKHAGVGLALHHAVVACVAGFAGPVLVGALVQQTGSFTAVGCCGAVCICRLEIRTRKLL
jgi:hypothetical protein